MIAPDHTDRDLSRSQPWRALLSAAWPPSNLPKPHAIPGQPTRDDQAPRRAQPVHADPPESLPTTSAELMLSRASRYERSHRLGMAMVLYSRVLLDYPASIAAGVAQRRLNTMTIPPQR